MLKKNIKSYPNFKGRIIETKGGNTYIHTSYRQKR